MKEVEKENGETFIEEEVTLRLCFPKKWLSMTKGGIQKILNKYIEELTKSQSQSQSQLIGTSTSAPEETPVAHINPLPQWQPSNNNNAGPGGVRFRYTDLEKYESFRKEDADDSPRRITVIKKDIDDDYVPFLDKCGEQYVPN